MFFPAAGVIYRNSLEQTEHVVLTKGKIDADKPTVRLMTTSAAAETARR